MVGEVNTTVGEDEGNVVIGNIHIYNVVCSGKYSALEGHCWKDAVGDLLKQQPKFHKVTKENSHTLKDTIVPYHSQPQCPFKRAQQPWQAFGPFRSFTPCNMTCRRFGPGP